MLDINVSESEMKAIGHERYHHPHPRVQMKMEALWLKGQGLPHHQIAKLTGVCENTLLKYFRTYIDGGIEKIKETNFYQPKSELEEYKGTIEEYFRKNPPSTINEAVHKIEELTGIKRSPTQVRKFLTSIGMKFRKVGVIPSKADAEEQEKFKKEELEPRLEEAKNGQRAVFFVDAAHFVYGAFLGFLWSFVRLFIKAPAGRKRFNVLGAMNAITHELITVSNDTYINAGSFCELLWKLYCSNLNTKITLVLDNAGYQKCRLVQVLAEHLNIELLYLPSYSPNLNIIERLWKFVKNKCLYSKYYPDFNSFKNAISSCLNKTHNLYKEELDTLLTLKFQTFQKVEIITA